MHLKNVDPNVKILGRAFTSILTNLQSQEIQDALQSLNLHEIDPDHWYPITLWWEIFDELEKQPNLASRLVAIGMEISRTLPLPDDNFTIQEIMETWDTLYHGNHRDGDVGHIEIKQVDNNHYHVIHPATYPEDFTYGVAYGLLKRFVSESEHFTIQFHPDFPRMRDGSDNIHFLVTWGHD